jgi:glycosyltransferase involved in cell wall biosynthesis
METFPFVSVVTPTYNRRRFIPAAIACFNHQTYPKNRMEWIIIDDGSDSVEDLFIEASKVNPNIRYIRLSEKQNIGFKRNLLNKEAKGDIIVAMDDDDYYPPERISHCVQRLRSTRLVDVVGSSEMYFYFSNKKEIWKFGPMPVANHTTNGPIAYRKVYCKKNKYDETVTHAEESSFLNAYKTPISQLESRKCILVIAHSENTYNKEKLIDGTHPFMKKTSMKLKDFIKDTTLRDFYSSA